MSRGATATAAAGSGHRPILRMLVLVGLVAAAGCFGLRPTVEPIPTLDLVEGPPGADCLVVLLPGRGDSPRDFLRNDFAGIAAGHGLVADIVAVDSHMGYFRQRVITDRLHEDVIAPAHARGQRVWLAGISLGGLASLLYMAEHPGEVEGAVLLSPFLGRGPAVEEVAASPSLAAWKPSRRIRDDVPLEGDDVWLKLWERIRSLTDGDGGDAPLYLAYATGDRLAASHRLLARELPADHVFTVDGGHDWEAWDELWRRVTAAGVPACRPSS